MFFSTKQYGLQSRNMTLQFNVKLCLTYSIIQLFIMSYICMLEKQNINVEVEALGCTAYR